jgi:hypothetical protein
LEEAVGVDTGDFLVTTGTVGAQPTTKAAKKTRKSSRRDISI